MYYIAKDSKINDGQWKNKVIDNYVTAIKNCKDVDEKFLDFVTNDNGGVNIQINERSCNYFSGYFDFEINYKVTLTSTYTVSDGYKIETEKQLFTNKTQLYAREQSHRESVSTSDIVTQNVQKYFFTHEDYVCNKPLDKNNFKKATKAEAEKLYIWVKILKMNYSID